MRRCNKQCHKFPCQQVKTKQKQERVDELLTEEFAKNNGTSIPLVTTGAKTNVLYTPNDSAHHLLKRFFKHV
jgi:hypothetical protein